MTEKIIQKSKKLKVTLIIIAVIVVAIFTLRIINGVRFSVDPKLLGGYIVGGDMDAYPLEQEGVTITPIKDEYVKGFRMIPDEKSKSGLIVMFGGSDGGVDFDHGVKLAKEGYEIVSLFYFGQENQPIHYNNVPLEFFKDFLDYAKTYNIDTSPLTLIGISKGAELTLTLSNYYDEIDNIVLYAPSSYVFQGGDMMAKTSSWTYEGKELPYVKLLPSIFSIAKLYAPMVINYPIAFREFQANMILKSNNSEETPNKAQIDISNYNGNILIFAGADDQVWPADVMGQMIKDSKPEQTELNIYPNAGHVFVPSSNFLGMANGGTISGNVKAQIDSESKLREFLRDHHK